MLHHYPYFILIYTQTLNREVCAKHLERHLNTCGAGLVSDDTLMHTHTHTHTHTHSHTLTHTHTHTHTHT
jgi:hypothetical protein